jgi:transcriptional regulator with XRE-family HTH domain
MAAQIRLLRNSSDRSLKAVAAEGGLSAGFLSNIEGGLVCCTVPTLVKVARGLRVDPAVLLVEPLSRFGGLAERASLLPPEALQVLHDHWDEVVRFLHERMPGQ